MEKAGGHAGERPYISHTFPPHVLLFPCVSSTFKHIYTQSRVLPLLLRSNTHTVRFAPGFAASAQSSATQPAAPPPPASHRLQLLLLLRPPPPPPAPPPPVPPTPLATTSVGSGGGGVQGLVQRSVAK